jgi:ABC-type Fe3+/spermidine/putrescine transport system ATPase subunit
VANASHEVSRPLADLRLEAISTRLGQPPQLDAVSIHVRYGEFFTFLGPPHSGKSAVLRVIAGFLPASAGQVEIDGVDVADLPPARRGVGLVFHEGALWPHMSARDHVAFGLQQQRLEKPEIERRVQVVLGRLGLLEHAALRPADLGLDARRRLAIARAVAVEPRVLLLDEPLAHLDPVHRKTLRIELAKLHADLAVTTICATRDAADAMALSNRIAVMIGGRIVQLGEPEQIYRQPVNRTVAEALGPATFLPVQVVEVRDLGVVVETERGDQVPVTGIGTFREGSRGMLVLRPETVSLSEAGEARGPGIPGRIALRVFEGARYLYEVDVGASVPVRMEVPSTGELRMFRLGERVRVEVSSDTVVLIPDGEG